MKNFTRKELARYNGKGKVPALIAYNGKVYDVSRSFLWKDGTHQVIHNAGEDLTDDLEKAPHGADLLNKFPVVGKIHED
ncbi:MAG: cytochrome b5 domain-containing protein [Methanocellales archaeon]|nr:cytochrome b5 domain-containing protein [Methanocellales archaeon]MDD3421417.1 cytochrome b5 domain-containing protein [Methanocellales archaeon]MDD4897838.1 cytochrome b5 domain-containing protein [Methanocellales archaeon]MDD5447322.1 cytochrome b5 domain-containing protein [Methanocellales archaeon]